MILSHHHAAMRSWIFVTGLATTLTVALADDLGTRDDGAVTYCTGYFAWLSTARHCHNGCEPTVKVEWACSKCGRNLLMMDGRPRCRTRSRRATANGASN